MQIYPQGNKFQRFVHWSQSTLQDSNLKNTWNSILERFPSLLSGLSLKLPREHSAQFMTIYRLNIWFSFFSPPHLPQLAQSSCSWGRSCECRTKSIVFHSLVSLSAHTTQAIWRVEITFPRNQHVWALWTQEDAQQQINQSIFGLHLFSSLLEKNRV